MSESVQPSFFDKVVTTSYLNVVKDMVPVQMEVKEIFDQIRYQELYAITFVASPNYFFHHTKDFQKVKLIMGIADSKVSASFKDGLSKKFNLEGKLDFWNGLSDEERDKFINNTYQIRYASAKVAIHSKIYLLKGKDCTRCIVGSANFTENAFSHKPQFEDILIFDNNEKLFNHYMKRFKEIEEFTEDYIPERIKRTPITQVLVDSAEVMKDIILDEAINSKITFQVTEKEMEELQLIPETYVREKEDAETLSQIIELVTKKERKTGNRILLSKTELEKKTPIIKTVIYRSHKNIEEQDIRKMIVCHQGNYCLYTSPHIEISDGSKNELIRLSEKLSDNEIKERLLLIHGFIDAYNKFTVKKDIRNQARIYEIILYGFMAPYLWKARDHYALHEGREAARRDISPFLIVAGRSMSGKTTAIEFLGNLMGSSAPNYISFEKVSNPSVLRSFFDSENLHPVLLDEIDQSFFTGKKGERIIKYASNELKGQHPVIIGTTNASGFNITPQSTSRVYYLQINNTFDKDKTNDSARHLKAILDKVDDKLFKDFSFRIANKISEEIKFYEPGDFLYAAREIFKEYYHQCGLELPPYFPTSPFKDYDERGKTIWKELYTSFKGSFEIRKDVISIKIDDFSTTMKDKQSKINYLPVECIIEDQPILVVKKDIFFNYIEEGEKGFVKKMMAVFKK